MIKIQLLVNRRNGIGLEFCLVLQLKENLAKKKTRRKISKIIIVIDGN